MPITLLSDDGRQEVQQRPSPDGVLSDSDSTYAGTPENEINELARRITSTQGPIYAKNTDDTLDPESSSFDPKRWVRAFYKAQVKALGGIEPNTAGLAFRNLNVYGQSTSAAYQRTVGTFFHGIVEAMGSFVGSNKKQKVDILHNLEGVLESGEMLCVLGPPGSGCSTFLKTIAGETYGFQVDEGSSINYQGLSAADIQQNFKGEAIYTAEVDHHFPRLTVGETLYFAARTRCPQKIDKDKHQYAQHLRDVVMAMLGITHTKNTRVGDDYLRGVSGGERKRVTIAEAVLNYSPWQCWDNSTRGLDAANAINFCRTLRLQSEVFGSSVCVAIYQAPQEAYELFDKVLLLYEGRQIFFGRTSDARAYFEGLGFECPEQQTTPDFLTSMTSASERQVKSGWQGKTPPRSPNEFAQAWVDSQHREILMSNIESFERHFPHGGEQHDRFSLARKAHKSNMSREASPYTLSYVDQLGLNLWRGWKLLKSDPWMSLTMLFANFSEALIVSSIFYQLGLGSETLERRNLLIFFTILINAMGSILEILTLYGKRKIVEKHNRYALYRPSSEALAAMIVDLPYKILNSLLINLTVYFMCNLRPGAGPFFAFLLFSFTITLTMSMMFRLLGSLTKTISQALAPSAIILMAIMLFSGFALPASYVRPWIGWLRWVNPVFYTQEALAVNELVGREFPCSSFVPSGPGYDPGSMPQSARVCSVEGSITGETSVDGLRHLETLYSFSGGTIWRNYGILVAWTVFYMMLHLLAVEMVSSERSKGEILVFPRWALKRRDAASRPDEETSASRSLPATQAKESNTDEVHGIKRQTSIFHWRDVCYSVKVKGEERTILDHVDGWVQPGTLTALMGVSGAGKTSLLDVLASRVTMGIISGQMLVDGQLRDSSFQRKTGYVTQQDLHLATSTVREALRFSALLRQPARYSREEKIAYADEVVKLVDLDDCVDAIIGSLGEGLNVEQRKRLTIGIELAARPELLLFLDEPTSGLDSQTSWSICDLMEKLTKNGQAILCTIHQPSAALFQRFDRLLLLARGGRTTYFGPVGRNAAVLLDYLARNGARPFVPGTNPAEYMLDVIASPPPSGEHADWPSVWKASPEYQSVQRELDRLAQTPEKQGQDEDSSTRASEFAAKFRVQLAQVTKRVFQQYWRTPDYILSKFVVSAGSALFIGLTQINEDVTQRGLYNQMLCVYIFLFIFAQIVEQMMPMFVTQRSLYEARERPAKAYSWVAFIIANITVELAWNSIMSVFSFLSWYFPMGLYRNAEHTDAVHSRGITVMLHVWVFFMLSSTFGNMMIAGIETAEVAGGLFNLLFILMFAFAGVLAGPGEFPGFWIFMYRVNPLTYVVDGFMATTLANAPVTCIDTELVQFEAPGSMSCGEYAGSFIERAGGYLVDEDASSCSYCGLADTNEFLVSKNLDFDNRWRNFGLVWAFCAFNMAATVALYWLLRVPKRRAGGAK